MTKHWVTADRIFDGVEFKTKHAICVADGKVIALKPLSKLGKGEDVQHHRGLISPGFFDIQVNGGGGVFLNSDPTVEGVKTIAATHRKLGSTDILPTVITDQRGVMEDAALACLEARENPGVRGIHIEGPHISVSRRGTHDARFVRPMDRDTIALVRQLRDANFPTLITVAPENTTNKQIAELADMGAVVSIGHSDATAETIEQAILAGVTCFTHLFNAMSPMVNRAPGVTGAAIASEVWCSVIADGIHVDPLMISIAANARPIPDRMISVSDAMATVGGPDTFDLYGQTISLKDGRLINSEGSLAGAHLTMAESLKNLIGSGIPEVTAMRMCRHNPAQLLGLWDEMSLIGTSTADLLLLNDRYEVCSVGINVQADNLQPIST